MARFEVTKNNCEVVDGEKFYRDRYKIPDGVIVRDENISYKLGHYKEDGIIKDYKVIGHIIPFYDEVVLE